MNGNVINSIVLRRPIKLMMKPIGKHITAAPMFNIELSSAHSAKYKKISQAAF